MATPYLTPQQLRDAPTGISWKTLPSFNSTVAQQEAAQTDICWRASADIDEYCNQVLRATINSEDIEGPDFRVTIRPNGVARVVPSQWFLLGITSVQVAQAATFPASYTTLAADQYRISRRMSGATGVGVAAGQGVGPSEIMIAPGWLGWDSGRYGYLITIEYTSGWPHAGLTADAAAAATSIEVDDCTGWALNGLSTVAMIFDGSETEQVTVTAASASSGPGTLTLAAGLANAHVAGVLVTTLPASIQESAIYFAMAQALQQGATATAVPVMPGGQQQQAGPTIASLRKAAQANLNVYRRVI